MVMCNAGAEMRADLARRFFKRVVRLIIQLFISKMSQEQARPLSLKLTGNYEA
jgi:hypothetical protein